MENRIVITHFVNPTEFWYKRFRDRMQTKLYKLFEQEIDEYCKEHFTTKEHERDECYEPALGKIVAVYDHSKKMWTRCVVESSIVDKHRLRKYRLRSLDDGVPKEATAGNLKPLPEKFIHKGVIRVKRGAIRNVVPAHQKPLKEDPADGQVCNRVYPPWDGSINRVLQSLIDCADQTYLENVTSYAVNGEDIYCGDLRFVTEQNTNVDATNFILNLGSAMAVDHTNFLAYFGTTGAATTKDNNSIPSAENKQDLNDSTAMVGVPMINTVNFTSTAKQSLSKAMPDSKKELPKANSGILRFIQAKPNRHLKQMPQQIHNEEKTDINNTPQSIYTTNQLLNPKSYMILASKPCRDPVVSKHILNSPDSLKLFTVGSENADQRKPSVPRLISKSESLVTTNATQTPTTETTASATNEQTESQSATNVQSKTLPVSVSLADIVPEGVSDENLTQLQDISTMSTNDTKSVPLTIQTTWSNKRFDKFIKEEHCVLSRLCHHRILVHGNAIPKPIDSIANANFSASVHRELEHLRIRTVYRLQAYAWPHIMRGNSLVCVNTTSTGKTFAFVPAMCSLIKIHIAGGLVSSDAGPVGIVLCYSSREVQRVAHFCRRMLDSEANKHLAVVECHGIRNVTKTCNLLFSGCALLVTTAPAYRRLYETMPESFVRKRIQIIAIDNIEEMLRHFATDIQLLCKNCDKPELQMIVTAGFWNPALTSFLRKYNNMIVCIGAHLEAAVYAKVQFLLRLRRNDGSKQDELARYIKEVDYRTQRTIVFGSISADLDPIVETLRQHSINHLVCNGSTVINQHDGFRNWDERLPGDMIVLVCLDELLGDLNVSKAQHIVHYTLPSSWSSFTRRFATSFQYYDCPFLTPDHLNGDEKPKGRPSTLVLVDENNNHQLPKLIDFLELHNVTFPQELSNLAQNIRNVHEYTKLINGTAVSALCPRLLGLAACRNYRSCVYRHALSVNDLAKDDLPTAGMIRLNILHVFSPVHFAARIEAHRARSNCTWTKLNNSKQFLVHDITMQTYFANADRHQLYGKVMRNDLCAIFDDHNYWRCRIIHFEEASDSSATCEVQLKLIDTGRIMHAKSTSLLCLPDKFRSLPGQAIDVRIGGVVPHDFEEEWDKYSTVCVQRWIDGYVRRQKYYADGKVVLALQDTLWIDDLLLVESLDGLKTEVVSMKVKASIVSKQFGVHNTDAFERIRSLVQQCEANRKVPPSDSAPIAVVDAHKSAEKDRPTARSENTVNVIAKSNPILFPNHSGTGEVCGDKLKQAQANHNATKRSLFPCHALDSNKKELDRISDKAIGSHATILPVEENNSVSSGSSFEVLSPSTAEGERYSFDSLEKGNHYNIVIGRYYAPDKFYVYQLDKVRVIQQKINEYTANKANVKPLTDVRIGGYCLVYYDSIYQRGQVVEVRGTETIVFFLDFGGTIDCYRDELFEISDHLLQQLPFAAIEGTFAFIEPLVGGSWTKKVGDAIYDDVLEKYNSVGMFALVIEPRENGNRLVEGCHRYEMLLTDGDSTNPFSIVSELVQLNLAMFVGPSKINNAAWDETTTGDGDDEDEEDDSFVQLNFTHEEVKAFLANISKPPSAKEHEKPIDDHSAVAISSPHSLSSSSIVELTKVERANSPSLPRLGVTKRKLSKPKSSTPAQPLPMLPPLDCDYRIPQTVWRQDDFFVMLYVSAPDVSRYDLTVHIQSLLLQFVRDDQSYLLPLNLFGPIEPQHTTHEVRGLTIVIRLVTRGLTTWRWPTLVSHSDKLTWLKKAISSQRQRCGESGSGSDLVENNWNDLLPSKLDGQMNSESCSSDDEEDEFGLEMEDAMEEEIFLNRR